MNYEDSLLLIARKRLLFLKYIGLLPITIVDGKSVTRPIDLLSLTVSLSVGVFISYIYFVRREDLFTSKSDIANFGNFVSFMASIWVSIISMMAAFIFRHRTWKIILKVVVVEQKVKFSNFEVN